MSPAESITGKIRRIRRIDRLGGTSVDTSAVEAQVVTPAQRHANRVSIILGNPERLYAVAKSHKLKRWSGQTGNWRTRSGSI
jgi:hypothetical protein